MKDLNRLQLTLNAPRKIQLDPLEPTVGALPGTRLVFERRLDTPELVEDGRQLGIGYFSHCDPGRAGKVEISGAILRNLAGNCSGGDFPRRRVRAVQKKMAHNWWENKYLSPTDVLIAPESKHGVEVYLWSMASGFDVASAQRDVIRHVEKNPGNYLHRKIVTICRSYLGIRGNGEIVSESDVTFHHGV